MGWKSWMITDVLAFEMVGGSDGGNINPSEVVEKLDPAGSGRASF